ncbi:RnfH family protein [Psychrobacter piscatorii]|uniref:RnfH family protein n=1 Tax=Psychrobacter piscatorii TaxID=554343 RepID=UPI001D12E3ED|nr:RnfH family protein [Psychrobacter piscatorii]
MVELTGDGSKHSNSNSNALQSELMTVYLAYAEDEQRQHYLALKVRQGTSLYEALGQAGWLEKFAALAKWCEQAVDITTPTAKRWHVGIYAQKQPLNYLLQPFDRIEVYRSLSADPMSQRKNKSRG